MLSGKKSEKMHVRLTEDLAREVRAIADLEHRHIQDQIRVLILIGLQTLRHGQSDEIRRMAPLAAAQQELALPPVAAPRRTMPQREKRSA